MKKIMIMLWFLPTMVWADIGSIGGEIKFDLNSDNSNEMTLSAIGLGVGTTPSTNLHIHGNAIIENQLYVGGSSGSSDLNIQGSLTMSCQTISDNQVSLNSSILLCDTSTGNIELTLPNPATIPNQMLTFKKISNQHQLIISTNTYYDSAHFDELTLEGSDRPYVKIISNSSHYLTLNSSMPNPYTPWEPSAMSNLLAWYDASDESSIVLNSGDVSRWNDKSGMGYHMEQGTASRQPSYSSQDNVTFARADSQFLNNASLGGAFDHENVTILCFFKPTDISSVHTEVFGSVTLGGETGVNSRINTTQPYNIGTYSSDTFGRKPTLNAEELLILHNGDTNGAKARQVFSETIDSETKKSVGALSYSAFSIGASRSTTSRSFSGYIKEFLIINKDITDSERELLEGYIAWKWNRESDLPSDHPYRTDGSRFGQ